VHCKIQTRSLIRGGALHEEASIYQTKEHVKSGHWPQRAARCTGQLTVGCKFNSTPLHSKESFLKQQLGASPESALSSGPAEFRRSLNSGPRVWKELRRQLRSSSESEQIEQSLRARSLAILAVRVGPGRRVGLVVLRGNPVNCSAN
jgi:hypothetical protein